MKISTDNLSPKQALRLFLICSVAYYHRFESLIPDEEYDKLSRQLLDNWDNWQEDQHSYLISKENLVAGSMYNVSFKDYPTMIKVATDMRLRDHFEEFGGVVG